ncbi:uncharacterized protein PHALS_02617 [Plasmopara halstedii]|uniref:Uncharacterized protein n=1 Tax=Plasmopara halstedii TaxID=4781 RepID=A0A0P1AY63_PLAHL|nr:uncharacterized protein PHALS_02617 [Plasmopara halstedii]CEG46202.1 hypothetical protein PHALS_02617 [Plasmopara halstedii]|eukprot:XP_024582571.1 hypothetical protein PHALS_02617 [Plasmopara halstedii]
MTHCITAQEFWPVDLEKFHHVCPAYDSARQEAFLMLDRVAFGVGEDATYSIPTFFCCHDTAIGKEKQDPIIASPVIKRSFMILCGLIVEESQDAVSWR